ncbi:SpoIIE family protein phosphatase [Streptomyces sp. KMM 9044]|uniref:SpoIIE family protein phosphatase n=1 Tax=Streptomyces sp. KMM 9044 TaxID=2744474 RepID=UPI002151C13A|nr:SpoIIE family protein phosphatase [Streptomyces sp. KMM 9044]WAX76419.1 SpoIIE family protein phosphatase [Streptomyces sp. KMM 9044]
MGDLNAPGAPSQRFPPEPESVAEARRFVRAKLGDAAPGTVDTAQLLVSELVTNAVLHARTEIEVTARTGDGGVLVRVSDRRPERGLVPYGGPAYTGTGQGLALVERLASRHGVDIGDAVKTVWFELWPEGPTSPPPSDGWATATSCPGRGKTVTLLDVPAALCLTCIQHRHTLLNEVVLALAAGEVPGVTAEDLAVALDMNDVISAGVAATLRQQHAETEFGALQLWVPSDAGASVKTLLSVLDVAEEAARDERLLTLPALPRGRGFQEWLFDQIGGQLAGERPTAWAVMPREPGAGASEPVLWDAGQVQASGVAMIAADESNRIIAVSGPAADLLGWPVDDLIGQPLTTLIPEHLRKRHTVAFTSLLLSGRPRILGRSLPLPALHRDGELVPVRLFVESQETADGRTVFVAQFSPRGSVPSPPARPPGRMRPGARREAGGALWSASPGQDRRTGVGRAGGASELERLSLLADTGTALSSLADLNEGLRRVGRALTRWLADWCLVDLFTAQDEVERVCVVHRVPQGSWPAEYEGRLPPLSETAQGPLARALRGAGPLLLSEPPPPGRAPSPLDAHYVELFRRLGANSAVVVPLRSPRKVIGALTIARMGQGRPFTEGDLPLVDELARAIALRVENARLHQETRTIAERLQRSLLPPLPEIPRLWLAARYAASSATAEVGGDWYDCFALPDGDTALVIGDVAGHDLDAAIAMSQLRSMLRGIAVDRQEPPGEVLRRLDMANHTLRQETTATCVYGLIKELGTDLWELVHSSAGHLPPLLVSPDGRTRYLEDGAGLLLGVDPALVRPQANDAIPADSTVLLYTDGLIERRAESLDHALDRLRGHAAGLAHEPLDVFCDELLIGLAAGSDDDIAVLAVRPGAVP